MAAHVAISIMTAKSEDSGDDIYGGEYPIFATHQLLALHLATSSGICSYTDRHLLIPRLPFSYLISSNLLHHGVFRKQRLSGANAGASP
jgi:hypothetical protein